MTKRNGAGIFSRLRQLAAFWPAAAMVLPLAACSSVPDVASAPPSGLSSGHATNTGSFPNLNIAPQTAASQITPEEKTTKLSELETAKATQASASGEVPASDEARLKKIAATHAAAALAEIEGQ